MKAFVITLKGNEYSERCASRCITSAAKFGLVVEKVDGVASSIAAQIMEREGLEWTWADGNTKKTICPKTGLEQFPYTGTLAPKIGCSMSHYMLWKKCVELNEPILILEHDAVFINPLPNVDFQGICQINDPSGATRRGTHWSISMVARGPGVFQKTLITPEHPRMPDGLAGNSAYMIKPHAAHDMITIFKDIGVWPNDASMCIQTIPYLEELYPFVTKVDQTQSTTQGPKI